MKVAVQALKFLWFEKGGKNYMEKVSHPILFWVTGNLELIPADFGSKAGDTLDRALIYLRTRV